jgi:hypothetical protein
VLVLDGGDPLADAAAHGLAAQSAGGGAGVAFGERGEELGGS